jgi:membrane protein DedA with SNARE-associated domain
VGPNRHRGTPWEGRAERADLICLAGIAFSGIYGLALLPLVPSLVGTHPLLLEIFRGSMSSMVTMGALARTGHASLAVAIVAGIPGTMMFDWLFWWAGRRWGERALRMFVGRHPRAATRLERVHRLTARFGGLAVVLAYLLPVPNVLIYAAVGWGGMRLRTFLALDALGALVWVALMVGTGYAVGQPAVDVAHAVSHWALAATGALVVAIVLRQVWLARRARPLEGT